MFYVIVIMLTIDIIIEQAIGLCLRLGTHLIFDIYKFSCSAGICYFDSLVINA